MKKIETLPIAFEPGDRWDYRNTHDALLGVLIHPVTGQYLGDYLHDRIFAPLGMVCTRMSPEHELIPGRAAGCEMVGGELTNQIWVFPASMPLLTAHFISTSSSWRNGIVRSTPPARP